MAKKSKHATGKAFSVEISDVIRHHFGEIEVLTAKRENAFGDRDSALEELAEIDDKHTPEALKLKERHSDAIVLIDGLNRRIKWHQSQAMETCKQADSPEFEFMYDMPPEPPKKKDDPDQMKIGDGDTRPVGRVRGREVSHAQPDGENQHLTASVNELDMRDLLKSKCNAAGYTTVGALAEAIDKDEDLQALLSVTDKGDQEIRAAVSKYRKAHRKAAQTKEREAVGV